MNIPSLDGRAVLVTGGSGFIAGHVIVALLAHGASVTATLRSLDREPDVRARLLAAGMTRPEALRFVQADLQSDDGWAEAMAGIDAVLHVASPVEPGPVADEWSLVLTARGGTLRVLGAARDAGVRRLVLTSAFHAIAWGHPHDDHVFTEEDWTVLQGPGTDAYARSKTLAERAAWDWVEEEGQGMELVTLAPVAVMGPVLGPNVTGSNAIVAQLLSGAVSALPDLFIPVVDVRDVAAAHLLALATPAAAGSRFLLADGPALSMTEIAAALREALGADAHAVPTPMRCRLAACRISRCGSGRCSPPGSRR